MALIILKTEIKAPRELVFDLSRSVQMHLDSTGETQERVIAGKNEGLFELNDTVTWQAKHLGKTRQLSTKITEMDFPNKFTDEMLKGDFKSFRHEHFFEEFGETTIMTDKFDFQSPLGIIGRIVNAVFLKAYMTRFLKQRNAAIKERAEYLFRTGAGSAAF